MEQKKKLSMESIVRFMLNNKALILLIVLFVALSIVSPYFLTMQKILRESPLPPLTLCVACWGGNREWQCYPFRPVAVRSTRALT